MSTQVQLSLTATTPNCEPAERLVILACDGQVTKIGRASKTLCKGLLEAKDNFWITSPVMSRAHAEVWYDREHATAMIRDARSMHGTRLNGLKLAPGEGVALTDGDTLEFGLEIRRGSEIFPACQFVVGLKVLIVNNCDRDPSNTIKFPELSDVDDECYGSEDLIDDLHSLDGYSSDVGQASSVHTRGDRDGEYYACTTSCSAQDDIWKNECSSVDDNIASRASEALTALAVLDRDREVEVECVGDRLIGVLPDQLGRQASTSEVTALPSSILYKHSNDELGPNGSMLSSPPSMTGSQHEADNNAPMESRDPAETDLSMTGNHSWQNDMLPHTSDIRDKPVAAHRPTTMMMKSTSVQPALLQHSHPDYRANDVFDCDHHLPQSSQADPDTIRQTAIVEDPEAVRRSGGDARISSQVCGPNDDIDLAVDIAELFRKQKVFAESLIPPNSTKQQFEDGRRAVRTSSYQPFQDRTMSSTVLGSEAWSTDQISAYLSQPSMPNMGQKDPPSNQDIRVSETACFISSRSPSCSYGTEPFASTANLREDDAVKHNTDARIPKRKAHELSTASASKTSSRTSSSARRFCHEDHDKTRSPGCSMNLEDARPNRKLRRLAEATGCAVVGGLVASISIVSVLVASAPNFA